MDIQERSRVTVCVVNFHEFQLRKRTVDKVSRWIDKMMQSDQVRQILADLTLDR